MSKILYLEGACGISGDMTVAALRDLGASREKLDDALAGLHLEGFHYEVSRKKSNGISGCDFDVHLHSHAHHEHRNLADVYAVIDRGVMSDAARVLAQKIFRIVAEAEARAHGCPVDEVHFHEVGAIDSIADIVGAAVCVDDLQITDCIITGLAEGSGTVRCQHGDLPVPVPAVLNIAQAYAIALRPQPVPGEMVTPTGIAIAAALRTRNALPREYTVRKIGVGLGKRDFGRANFLRAMLIEPAADPERIYVVESNIDDSTGEELALAMEELFRAGARDVHFISCFMKKNRPAYLLRIIAREQDLAAIEETLFHTTTTIGLRKFPVECSGMKREMIKIPLPLGTVQVKKCSTGNLVRCYPEYESVKQVAAASGMDFRTVYEQARKAAEEERR